MSFRLLPKDPKFFDLFIADGENLAAAAAALHEMVEQYDRLEQRVANIQALEKRGDEIDREVTQKLEDAFVTPFDREDIHELVSRLDDVVDGIQSIAETFVIYGVEQPTQEAKRLAAILDGQAASCRRRCGKLDGLKGLEPHFVAIHELENEADGVSRAAMAALFHDAALPRRGHQVARPLQRHGGRHRRRRGCRRSHGADVPQGQLTPAVSVGSRLDAAQVGRRKT